jgi:hypothetical protein
LLRKRMLLHSHSQSSSIEFTSSDSTISDYVQTRELRGAGGGGGGGRGGGGGGSHGGGVSHHSGGSSSDDSCRFKNATHFNITSNTFYYRKEKLCKETDPLIYLYIVVGLLGCATIIIIYDYYENYQRKRRETADANNKAKACETLLHKLSETTCDTMLSREHDESYSTGWICDKCNTKHEKSVSFYRCKICGIDICQSCKSTRPLPTLMQQMSFNHGHGYNAAPAWQQPQTYALDKIVPVSATTNINDTESNIGNGRNKHKHYEMVSQEQNHEPLPVEFNKSTRS